MSEKKMSDLAKKKTFTKSLALIKRSQRSVGCSEQNFSTHITTATGLLAEFLTSIMTKDYEQALIYCTQILCTEPKNTTAREFYPLIVEKLEMMENDDSSESSTTSDSSLSSSSSENIFFNKASQIALKSENSPQKLNETFNLGLKITENERNIAVSSSFPFPEKNLKKKNKNMLEYSISYEKPTREESILKTESKDSNVLVHPTPTITLVQNTAAETKMASCSNPDKKNQTQNLTGNKRSLLLHMSPTITLSRSLPPSNEILKMRNRYPNLRNPNNRS